MAEVINIRTIAEAAGCSPSTVSRVLSGRKSSVKISDSTRSRILALCESMDYQPSIHASRLFSKRAGVIGFLMSRDLLQPDGRPVDDNSLARALFSACQELLQYDFRCLPLPDHRRFTDPAECLNIYKRQEVDALIIWGAREDQEYLEVLRRNNRPFLLLANKVRDLPTVYCEQRNPIAALVAECRRQGAGRISAVMSHVGYSYRQRELGLRDAVGDCVLDVTYIDNGMSVKAVYEAAPEIMKFKPDAVVCANDAAALGMEKYLLEHGIRVPEDVMLTGGDNILISEVCPVPISTFDQMAARCAARSVGILMDHLLEDRPLCSEEIAPELLLRRSTARKK